MSPTSAERSPLSPVEGNILQQAAEPPPLELPEPLKEVRRMDDEPEELRPPQLQRVDSGDAGEGGFAHSLRASAGSGAILVAAGVESQIGPGAILAASDEAQAQAQAPRLPRSLPIAVPQKHDMDMDVDAGDIRLVSSAPPLGFPAVKLFAESAMRPNSMEDEGAHSAIQALLALQRDESPRLPLDRPASICFPHSFGNCQEACPPSPTHSTQSADSPAMRPAPKPGGQPQASRFYCRYPRCGKGYASTDAVRKHCRQRHLEWLRRLGHGCPALYCRWEE